MRGTSLVAQWLRIYLPVQGSRVWSLVQEDSTCCRATKPIYCNCWRLRALEAVLCEEKPPQCETHALQLEKACTQQWRPSTAFFKEMYIKKKKFMWNIHKTGHSLPLCSYGLPSSPFPLLSSLLLSLIHLQTVRRTLAMCPAFSQVPSLVEHKSSGGKWQ